MTVTDQFNHTVLQIVPRLAIGGAERTTIDIAEAIINKGGRALVACEHGVMVDELVAKGGEWIDFPAATKNPAKIIANALALAKLIRQYRVIIIHARSRAPAWSALIAAYLTNIPLITTYHGIYSQSTWPKALYNSVMAKGEVVIANSNYTARIIAKRHPKARGRIKVIYRSIAPTMLNRQTITKASIAKQRRAWGIAKDDYLILVLARFSRWKGQDLAIAALGKLHPKNKRLMLVLAGDHHDHQRYVGDLRQLAQNLKVSDNVHLVDKVAANQTPSALSAADLIIVPSTRPEAFGRVSVEAQAMAKPVLVSDHGPASETVLAPPEAPENQRTGWRFSPGNSDVLAQAIETVLTIEPAKLAKIIERSQDHAQRNFSLARLTKDTLNVYRECLKARSV